MRGGGGSHSSRVISDSPPEPKIYGIVVGPDGHHYVESFNLLPESGSLKFYTSSQQPPKQMTLQVTDDPVKMGGRVAASAIPRPVAIIQYDVSQRDEHNNPSAILSENLYLYSSNDNATTALRQLMRPAAVIATGHVSKPISNSAKTLLHPVSFTPSEIKTAHALGGLSTHLFDRLLQQPEQLRLSPESYAKMAKSMNRAPPTTPGGSRSRRRRRR